MYPEGPESSIMMKILVDEIQYSVHHDQGIQPVSPPRSFEEACTTAVQIANDDCTHCTEPTQLVPFPVTMYQW